MKRPFKLILIILLVNNTVFLWSKQPKLKLWYKQPAVNWMTSALPIGNGELGAMIFGGVDIEHVQFNEKTLWEGDIETRGAYQNFGDLYLNFQHDSICSQYVRSLSVDDAIAEVNYVNNGISYNREYFASNPDEIVAMKFTTSDKSRGVNLTVELKDAHDGVVRYSGNTICQSGKLKLLSYESQVKVINHGGVIYNENNRLVIKNAENVVLLLSAGTNYDVSSSSYIGMNERELHDKISRRINRASSKSYRELRKRHIEDYKGYFNRVKLDLGVQPETIPTDELLREKNSSKYLDILYFQYGRYLMISSSRGMSLPNNLQGIWNDVNAPAWECDIHSNINIQMNYWPAEVTNLSACHLPFINYVHHEAAKTGGSWQKCALEEDNRGWTVRTQSNIFGFMDWNINRPANAWYCLHLWQHYIFSKDKEYLLKTAYPTMKSACVYWFDRLKMDKGGYLIAPDEWSPEQGPWEDGVAYAQQLVWELFNCTRKIEKILNIDKPFFAELNEMFAKLDDGLHIGEWGQIREWKINPDEKCNNHRHLSHLISLYPGYHIGENGDKKYVEAAKTTLTSRGDGGTGWSRAWKISCWARLLDGNHAYRLLKHALHLTYVTTVTMDDNAGGVYENLLDAHPSFQIDGNFGATAGIAEILVQSHKGYIHLLPAVPSAWESGSVEGLCVAGAFTLNMRWDSLKLTHCSILSKAGEKCVLHYPDISKVKRLVDAKGRQVNYNIISKDKIEFVTNKNNMYNLNL